MVQAPDWQEVETTLFEKSKEAIERFAKEHPDVQCSFFAYSADPISGEFAISIDTPENALQQARKEELRVYQWRKGWLATPDASKYTHEYLKKPNSTDYTSIVDYFQFAFYEYFMFDGWTTFFDSDSYPESQPLEDDYLAGNVRIIIWKVFERLIQEQVFSQLNTTSFFRLGYYFHEEDLIVLRILNWPTFPKEE